MEAEFGFNIRCVSRPGCEAALNSSACGGVMRRPHVFEAKQAAMEARRDGRSSRQTKKEGKEMQMWNVCA